MGYLKLECSSCGGKLQMMQKGYANCPHCGQNYLIDKAGLAKVDITIDYGDNKKTQNVLKGIVVSLAIGLVLALLIVVIIFAFNADARNSKLFSELRLLPSGKYVEKMFFEDIFEKDYYKITKEEFAGIKYISYDSERYGNTNDWIHIVEYSYTDYKDCASEEEFQATIRQWTCRDTSEQSNKLDFSELSGLTRVDLNNEWGWNKFPKDANITYVDAQTENFKSVSELVNAEKVEVLFVDAYLNLEGIEKFPNLKELTVDMGHGYNTFDISLITECKGLKKLSLEGYQEGYVGLEKLAELTTLEEFAMEDSDICLADCTFLSDLTNLKALTVFSGDDPDLSILETMPQLKSLSLFGYGDWIEASQLKYLPRLEHLSIDIQGVEALEEIAKLEDLQTLDIDLRTNMVDKVDWYNFESETVDLSVLCKLTKLEQLTMKLEADSISVGVPVKGMEAFLGLEKLKEVRINEQYQPRFPVTDESASIQIDTELFQGNTSLERLQLVNCRLVDENDEAALLKGFLTEFPNLRIFIADYCGLKDVSFLAEAAELRACSLVGNEIEDLQPLNDCKKLDVVALYGNPGSTEELSEEIVVLEDEFGECNLSEYLEGIEKVVGVIK
ncbi:MAG: hypothetical protein IJ379_13520 [Lachnospiraceae bacterium]|nr:hypothetical protein [Lachnospiraceae bacterium]